VIDILSIIHNENLTLKVEISRCFDDRYGADVLTDSLKTLGMWTVKVAPVEKINLQNYKNTNASRFFVLNYKSDFFPMPINGFLFIIM
jgi:hypothetical protein